MGLRERAKVWLTDKKTGFAFSSIADYDHFAAYIGIQHLRLTGIREMHQNSYREGQDKTLELLKVMIGNINPELKGAGVQHWLWHSVLVYCEAIKSL